MKERVEPGVLIALEGIDGSGKSTAVPGIVSALRGDGRSVVATREPTDGPWGRRIRDMARSGETIDPAEELRWFNEDRREHVGLVLAQSLELGKVVVTDRYFLSTVAYQGARGLDWKELLADAEREFRVPDLALIFEIDPAAGLARTHLREGAAETAFEEVGFLETVAAIYAAIDRPWIQRVDATGTPPVVLADALERIRAVVSSPARRG